MKKFIFALLLLFLMVGCSSPASIPTPTIEIKSSSTPAIQKTETVQATDEPLPVSTASLPAGEMLLKIIPQESTVSYTVNETFLNQNNRFNTAIGSTSEVNGEIFANPEIPTQSRLGVISVDISTFKSDNSKRDNMIRKNWLESLKYPLVTFVPRSMTGLPDSYVPGQSYTFEVQGELTIRDKTLGSNVTVTASYDQGQLTGTAETSFLMSDYGFGPISIAGILNTEDLVKVKLDFVARP